MNKTYYVYLLTNWNDKVMYVGMTNDLERRVYEHKNKLVIGFTAKYNVHKLVYYEETNDVYVAIAREKEIKKHVRHSQCLPFRVLARNLIPIQRSSLSTPHSLFEPNCSSFLCANPAAQSRHRHGLVDGGYFNDKTGTRNEFLAVTQLWLKGDRRYRRPDVLIYINGLPLVFIELKNANHKVKNAYDDNLTNYKQDIPRLFQFNAFCILSNALETRVGSFNASWEFFFNWLRPDDETEKIDRDAIREQGVSIERAIAGLCLPKRLLDYIENFVIYHNETKIIAQNHQFIGVNKALARLRRTLAAETPAAERSKLGVFWHTQGSGKSFSMIFYTRKIFRKMEGDYTFVIVTDRNDLDEQIYRNFLNTGTVQKAEAARPRNSAEMRTFLSQNKRFVFTLIHKFRYDQGLQYPALSERDNIIVIVDEAHRTQYKSLAENMRAGLPNARFLAFTGTPLLGRNRRTNAWFGDYVSEYNFSQSMDDGATVPLFYQKRVPEVLIQNEDLSDEFYEILEDENLDEAQQAKLENQFSRETEVIERDDRLETIADDIVKHFPERGYLGKGLVVCVDKFTAVKMYDKVQQRWKSRSRELRGEIKTATAQEKARLTRMLDFMRSTEMAVVISEAAGEEDRFRDRGLDLKPHHARMNKLDKEGHDIEHNFKDPHDPVRLVFVCAMWLTGFDAPTLSTLYLDKPMRDHTLMQAIARANRVSGHKIHDVEKRNGEIIDYYNVFRNMKKALAEGQAFCGEHGIELEEVLHAEQKFKQLDQFKQFVDILLRNDERRKSFNVYLNTISALYEACKPEIFGRPARKMVYVFQYLRGLTDAAIDGQNIGEAARRIAALLDESIVASDNSIGDKDERAEYKIVRAGKSWDLSKLNIEKLKEEFQDKLHKHIEIADLRAFLEKKLAEMLEQNVTRTDFAERLQAIIDSYNSGSSTVEQYYEELLNFNRDLAEEDERHIRVGLAKEELELFDLIKKDKMTKAEEMAVKTAAQSLLKRLRQEDPRVLVQDWHKDSQSQRQVQNAIEKVLDAHLPQQSYGRMMFKRACDNVYQRIYDGAYQGRAWAA